MQPKHQIFRGISTEDFFELQKQLQVETKHFPKGALLLSQGDENKNIFFLEHGRAHAVRYTADGREVDYTLLKEGDLFGKTFFLPYDQHSPVNIFADCDCTVLYFPYYALLNSDHPSTRKLLMNLTEELTKRIYDLQQRIRYLTCFSLREKLLAYLCDCHTKAKCDSFCIPHSRTALASFLCCDRSALCRELSRMKNEGIIEYRKNAFRFLVPQRHFEKND